VKDLVLVGRPLDVEVRPSGEWKVTPYGWVAVSEWEQIKKFQSDLPQLPLNFPERVLDDLLRDTTRWNSMPWAQEVEERIRSNPSKSVLWTVLYTSCGGDQGGVDMVTMGRETLIEFGWLDRLFRPVLRVICWTANTYKKYFGKKVLKLD
jgi:hypothetical protein